MAAAARTNWIGLLLRGLPGPLHRMLDAWSHRVALRKARERQARWAARQAPRKGS